jgi:hypothetical protein
MCNISISSEYKEFSLHHIKRKHKEEYSKVKQFKWKEFEGKLKGNVEEKKRLCMTKECLQKFLIKDKPKVAYKCGVCSSITKEKANCIRHLKKKHLIQEISNETLIKIKALKTICGRWVPHDIIDKLESSSSSSSCSNNNGTMNVENIEQHENIIIQHEQQQQNVQPIHHSQYDEDNYFNTIYREDEHHQHHLQHDNEEHIAMNDEQESTSSSFHNLNVNEVENIIPTTDIERFMGENANFNGLIPFIPFETTQHNTSILHFYSQCCDNRFSKISFNENQIANTAIKMIKYCDPISQNTIPEKLASKATCLWYKIMKTKGELIISENLRRALMFTGDYNFNENAKQMMFNIRKASSGHKAAETMATSMVLFCIRLIEKENCKFGHFQDEFLRSMRIVENDPKKMDEQAEVLSMVQIPNLIKHFATDTLENISSRKSHVSQTFINTLIWKKHYTDEHGPQLCHFNSPGTKYATMLYVLRCAIGYMFSITTSTSTTSSSTSSSITSHENPNEKYKEVKDIMNNPIVHVLISRINHSRMISGKYNKKPDVIIQKETGNICIEGIIVEGIFIRTFGPTIHGAIENIMGSMIQCQDIFDYNKTLQVTNIKTWSFNIGEFTSDNICSQVVTLWQNRFSQFLSITREIINHLVGIFTLLGFLF